MIILAYSRQTANIIPCHYIRFSSYSVGCTDKSLVCLYGFAGHEYQYH